MSARRHPQLELDIETVLSRTLTDFGTHQYYRYRQAILDAIEHVIAHPGDGRPCRHRRLKGKGYWFFPLTRRGRRARHRLVYLIEPDGTVYILCLLHDRMRIVQNLPPH